MLFFNLRLQYTAMQPGYLSIPVQNFRIRVIKVGKRRMLFFFLKQC